jgi:hypothetical protein
MTTPEAASAAAAAAVPAKDAAAESNTEATSSTTTNGTASKAASFYEEPEHLKKLCDFLRSRHGLPVREALLMEKRVHYLKGTSEDSTHVPNDFCRTTRHLFFASTCL